MTGRRRAFSGAVWEKEVGYCRAVRAGNVIHVSGTAPVAEDGTVASPGDAYGQARRCLEIIGEALAQLDADLSCVVRTRMYVTDAALWREVGRAHREFLGDHPPASTLIEVGALVHPDMLVEIEADAMVDEA